MPTVDTVFPSVALWRDFKKGSASTKPAGCPAVQAFLIQLATNARQHGYYVPTPRAMAGGA